MKRRVIKQSERDAITKVWGGKCAYCKSKSGPFAIDHIVPVSVGGSCDLENLCLSCVNCNSLKSDTRLPYSHEGLLLGVAKRKSKSIKRKLNVLTKDKKVKNIVSNDSKVRLPTSEGGEWVFSSRNDAGKIVRLLEAILEEDVTEVVEDKGQLPDKVITRSKTLDAGFFDAIGFSYEDSCEMLAGVIHELTNNRGWTINNLGWSATKKIGVSEYTFQFHKTKAQLNEFTNFVKRCIELYK